MAEEAKKKKPMSTAKVLGLAVIGAIVLLIVAMIAVGGTSQEDMDLSARQAVETGQIERSLESHRQENGKYPLKIDSFMNRENRFAEISDYEYKTNTEQSEFVFKHTRADGSEHEIRNQEWDE